MSNYSSAIAMRRVALVGPIPPPIGGFSVVTERMLFAMKSIAEPLQLNRSHGNSKYQWLRRFTAAFEASRLVARYIAWLMRTGESSLYVALSGGGGQWIDMLFVVIARVARCRIFIHHHSFAYIHSRRRSTQFVMRMTQRATHVVLCECMGDKLSTQYRIPFENFHILSNAAFVNSGDEQPERAIAVKALSTQFVVGFLGNITREKGIFAYFDVLEELAKADGSVVGIIAGPVAADIQGEFFARLARCPSVRHLGAVAGESKVEFLSIVDVLLFPSSYGNEAEPVTLWEALEYNTYVIATMRACIPSIVDRDSAGVLLSEAGFVVECLGLLLNRSRFLHHISAEGPRLRFLHSRADQMKRLDNLLTKLHTI